MNRRRQITSLRPLARHEPVLRRQKIGVEPRLGRSRLGRPVVAPFRERRHRQQDRLGAAVRLQSEQRAAIPDEVELDVARRAGTPGNRARARRTACRGAARGSARTPARKWSPTLRVIAKARVEAALVEVVVEDAADAARLLPVLEEEVGVAVALEARIELVAERRERVAAGAMKMARVFVEAVVRASGPCRRRTTTPALGVDRLLGGRATKCARSGARSAHTDCADAARAKRPAPPRPVRRAAADARVAEGGRRVAGDVRKQHARRARARGRPRATSRCRRHLPAVANRRAETPRRRRASSAADDRRLQADEVVARRRRCRRTASP